MPDLVVSDIGEAETPAPADTSITCADVVNMALGYLHTGVRVERDMLASGVSASAGTLITTYQVPAIKAGAKLNIDLEDYHVWSVSGANVTVNPGDFGSTAAAHSAGAIIHVNPEFSQFEVFREINNELRALSSPANGLYRVSTVTLTYNPTYYGYDLTDVTNVDGILTVQAETTGSDRARLPDTSWRLGRNLDTDQFPSGFALFTHMGWSGRDVFVAYRNQFGLLSSLVDNVETVTGFPSSAVDILAMGAALRLAGVAEIDRNQMSAQGNSRRANEVPAGSRVNAIRGLANLYRQRVVQEADRLKRAYPYMLPRR